MVDLCLGMSVQDPGTNYLSTASVNILVEWLAQYFMKFDRHKFVRQLDRTLLESSDPTEHQHLLKAKFFKV